MLGQNDVSNLLERVATVICSALTEAVVADITVVSWQAHGGEPVLGSFWATCFGADVAITASLHGGLRLWSVARLLGAATHHSSSQVGLNARVDLPAPACISCDMHEHCCATMNAPVHVQVMVDNAEHALVAEAVSPFGARVLELDVSLELGLLVCGDRWGNIATFSVPEEALSCLGGVELPLPYFLVDGQTGVCGSPQDAWMQCRWRLVS